MIFYKKGGTREGFTLIELLVVIAIIGILSSVVLASLNSAREKSRDAKRVADLKQIQLALELYFDDNNSTYPATLAPLTTGSYIPVIPEDPNGAAYSYSGLGGATCTDYHLRATLENAANPALDNDSDAAAGTACTGSAADAAGTDPIYDLKP
ncbi:MAG: prepilin-type N-terminal cleavage/methylation domain-containing protein [Parcubacteria group bacterium]|nr:prepilin-type N-terminal cleavage/methylation domain-containing protein [Parcubacteria group bacterium]